MGQKRNIPALIALLETRAMLPHAWGKAANDCASFSAAAVEAQFGADPMVGHAWTTERGAMRVLKRLAGPGVPRDQRMEKVLDALFTRIAPARAMRGDIGGVPDAVLGLHPLIVEGDMLVGPGERRGKRLPRRAMVAAWSTVPKADAR